MSSKRSVTVIGIGAMGGGMARALLESDLTQYVVGYDRASPLVEAFHQESQSLQKHAIDTPPKSLQEAILTTEMVTPNSYFVVLVLVNEQQCEQVCFGGDTDDNLLSLLPPHSCVILCATVTPTWARSAASRFASRQIQFLDAPMSGGPARARSGHLTLMASSHPKVTPHALPLLQTLADPTKLYLIEGGIGMGSTVKAVHQLLAGVHIAAAAEALAMGAKAGLNVQQLYEIVNGAAGASWMFRDRGARMIAADGDDDRVMSALNIFIKDLGIVHSEAKSVESPIPLASAALQQFIAGKAMGYGKHDDSQVIKVYEAITGVKVGGNNTTNTTSNTETQPTTVEGDQVGEFWRLPDDTLEEIREVGSEPRHRVVISNEFVRALRVSFPPQDTTLAHRHAEDSLYFFLVEGLTVVNHVKGNDPQCDCMEFGEIRYGTHRTEAPLVHKITNTTNQTMLCIDAEVLKSPPVTAAIPLVAEHHALVKTRDKCRVYKLSLPPGESVTVTYPFFYFTVVLKAGRVRMTLGSGGGGPGISWEVESELGDVAWKDPVTNLTQTNIGTEPYEVYIAEWR